VINYILSSLRPFDQNLEYAKLQLDALESWQALGSQIVYFNSPKECSIREGFQIQFVEPKQSPPTIYEMIAWTLDKGNAETSIAIVNSDIVLGRDINLLEQVVRNYQMTRNWAATSFRYTYDTVLGIHNAWRDPNDLGLDIFIAPRRIWEVIYREIPALGATKLTIGRILWDNTVNAYFGERLAVNRYIDLTPWKVVFHPVHGERGRHKHYDKKTVEELKILGRGGIPRMQYQKPQPNDRIVHRFS